jgi:hypothetical protein
MSGYAAFAASDKTALAAVYHPESKLLIMGIMHYLVSMLIFRVFLTVFLLV